MKSVTRIINSGSLVGNQPQPENRGELSDFARQNINMIFQRLQAIFPAWRTAYPSPEAMAEAKKIWVMALIDARICSTEQIARGMAKARQHEGDFFPSVGKFIGWCRPTAEDLGLPSKRLAWLEACNNSHHVLIHQWSHPAVYETGRRVGWFEIRTGALKESAFAQEYVAVLSEVAAGTVFNIPAADSTKLEHHTSGQRVTTEEAKVAAREAIDALKGAL